MSTYSRWLDVEVGTDDIDLNTLLSNVCLSDLQSDNEYKLLVADLGRGDNDTPKMKIFRGAMQMSDLELPDVPLGIVELYVSENLPRSPPVIAVAFASAVYIYRNMKLFFKYFLPSIEWNYTEIEIWKQLIDPTNHNPEIIKTYINNLQLLPSNIVSRQSQQFLQLNIDQQLEYLEQTPEVPVRMTSEITAVTTLKMNSADRCGMSCLVVGIEDGDVVILDPHTFTQIHQAKICDVKKIPYQMIATGLYNVDYRITVATREKCVCVVRRDWADGRLIFSTEHHITAMEVLSTDHSIVIICTDHTMACYSKKGKKLWTIKQESRPVALTLLPISTLGVELLGVALASGHVTLYDGKAPVDSMFVKDVVSVMKFGQLGQEEHVLIIITQSGDLMIKILKRTADFNASVSGIDTSPSVNLGQRPWILPKKSKLFIEQSIREKENATGMHERFQQELNRLRLTAASTLLEAHLKSDNSIGAGALEPVRLSAEVEGLGPIFRMHLIIHNTSADRAAMSLAILFHHPTQYKLSRPYIKVPLLAPGSMLQFPVKVEELFSELNPDLMFRSVTGNAGDSSIIKVLLLKEGRQRPVLAASVTMPPTDPIMLPYDKIQNTADFK